MNNLWTSIVNWFKSKGGVAHVVAAVYLFLVGAYAAVPAFHTLVTSIWGAVPAAGQEIIAAALGLYAWYRNNSTPPPPAA